MKFVRFIRECLKEAFRGGRLYWCWLLFLALVIAAGGFAYGRQYSEGLIVTGMSDQVSWGIYIANFTFLVGLAAAAVLLVVPAYIFHNPHARSVVLLGEGLAVAACATCIMFVFVDLGRPERLLHMLPFLGRLNWPQSMLAWDVVVLNGYLLLNFTIPMYVLYKRYSGEEPNRRVYFPGILIAIFWAISIHTVTAFLYSGNPSRPFWHTALLGPRFIASAFTAGPAFMILAFRVIAARTEFEVSDKVFNLLGLIMALALQISLFMVGVEIFQEFYAPTEHTISARYLFLGVEGHDPLVVYIRFALLAQLVALAILMVHRWRRNPKLLTLACLLAIVGIWIEKGIGLVIPGFVPTPLGEIFDYSVTWVETLISFASWAFGGLVFTVMAKMAIAIETGKLRATFGRNPA